MAGQVNITTPLPAALVGEAGGQVTNAGFQIDIEAVPVLRERLLAAIDHLREAGASGQQLTDLSPPGDDPASTVAVAGFVERAVGPTGSLSTTVDAAVSALTEVVARIDLAAARYRALDEEQADGLTTSLRRPG
ncbi:hypothetical protein [Actinoalloteichus hymeniacidonis]|uniref:PE domain-containing protein n=1 Tax=Actinoalloteichus hymeniacidonis TaxID=340345 RepID=A0AAC9N0V1_9PSEU|nr:hypothetical protein [Actinoalloteichus hymeniacidonis]AOS65984.1 hypothetical protein TL08_26075 [Actinoalloteichus hymeniacidonis]MBB5905914.1 hypothetical protein [Actinoalloteichus hymeniacidonis]